MAGQWQAASQKASGSYVNPNKQKNEEKAARKRTARSEQYKSTLELLKAKMAKK